MVMGKPANLGKAKDKGRPLLTEKDILIGQAKGGEYRVGKKLGEGGFGAVYRVQKINTPKGSTAGVFAMKVEFRGKRNSVLKIEIKTLKSLNRIHAQHSCRLIDMGRNDRFSYVIMTLMKDSLANLRRTRNGGKFSMSTALRSSDQMLAGIEEVHRAGFLHRDIKPANYCVGRPETDDHRTIYVLDFGIARMWRNNDGQMRRPRVGVAFRGTVRYAAVTAHKNRELGRRDDLESWLYATIELMAGFLPWRHKSDRDEVGRIKETLLTDKKLLCGTPDIFRQEKFGLVIANYIASLDYVDEPNYDHIRERLRKALSEGGWHQSDPYDWEGSVQTLTGVTGTALSEDEDAIKLRSIDGQNENVDDRTD